VLWNRICTSRGAQRAENFSDVISASVPLCTRSHILGQERRNRDINVYPDAELGVEG
jgi:hypothetical protein